MRFNSFTQNPTTEKELSNGFISAFSRTPHTNDDLFELEQSDADVNDNTVYTNNTYLLDVMANDRGGAARSLWSLDDARDLGSDGLDDLMSHDNIESVNTSAMGAKIAITADGMVSYTVTSDMQTALQSLNEGEFSVDSFIYSIQLANGVLSWATATVKIAGVNDAPELTGTIANLEAGTEGTPYIIHTSDLLAGFTDVDDELLFVSNLTATHGTLEVTTDGWIFTPDENFSGVVDLSYVVTDGHGGNLGAMQSFTLESAPIDTTAPVLTSSTPYDEATFKIENNLKLFFDEAVMSGIGDIIISNGSDTRTIAIDDTNQVTYDNNYSGSKSKIIINPTEDLIPNTSYNVQIANGAITDTAGNAYAGINDETTLNFTTIASNPLLFASNIWDRPFFKSDNDIQLYFDEAIAAGSGDITISNGSDTRTIAIDDASQVSFNDTTVIINPTEDLVPNTSYNIQMAGGAVVDTEGNAYAGVSDETTLKFMTTIADPLLISSYPWDGSTLKADNDIYLFFDEVVIAGSGDIIISNGSDTRTIAIDDASQVTFDDYGGVTINPSEDLIVDTDYHIQMASSVITDMNGNVFAGINDETTLNFTTMAANPLLTWSDPQDDSTFKIDNDIALYFDEMVIAGSGDILISNGSDTRTIDINDTTQVTFDDYYGVLINPTDDLILGTDYNIQIASGVITDTYGNNYAGISDETTLNFTTISTDPLLTWSTPQDESTLKLDRDIQLNFDEEVITGSGNIIISNGSDTRTIAIDDASQVSFNGSKVKINPTDDLIPNTNYNIQIASGVITDTGGNAYAGITDETTLNFTTLNSDPLLVNSNPWDDEVNIHISNDIHLYFDEMVVAGSGDIIISNGSDIHTIDINDSSQVSFDGYGSVIINPSTDLITDTSYNIQMASGVITDNTGNPYAGINDSTTLNFTTTDDPAFISMMGMLTTAGF